MKSAVAPSTRTARLARCRNWLRPHTTVPSVITLVSVALGSVLYVAGDQPIAYDALGYVDLGQRLYRDGLWTFMDKLRTYGYPAVLSLLMHLVGPDGPLLPIAIF
ncbi:MAG: hypothetical protein IT305_10730, partial [Chloroflexi bacterium]|nr:hypothetical protein [Chloroflexota bacterium]